jgi:hypothetical protein
MGLPDQKYWLVSQDFHFGASHGTSIHPLAFLRHSVVGSYCAYRKYHLRPDAADTLRLQSGDSFDASPGAMEEHENPPCDWRIEKGHVVSGSEN